MRQEYLRWRRVGPNSDMFMEYLRIDGSTSLEDRCPPAAFQRYLVYLYAA